MKRQLLTALFLTAATLSIAPIANAAQPSLQQSRYEVLDRAGSKAVTNLQMTRLEHLDNQTKAVENLQMTRLEHLDSQTKAVENLQMTRLEHLDSQTKAVENVQTARLEGLDMRSKGLF
jgi:LPS O-antigen subunit length determinant protein (WzzB/FepE family)